jgi:hypothetical protein
LTRWKRAPVSQFDIFTQTAKRTLSINQSIQMYGKVIARLEQEGHAVASVESEVKAETRFVETA